ncbi:hypothetical protein Cadr_000021633 [Camelus dromedarius]|uniref:Uncharacterized protein n=1 Tax=Camelus dromedarius TaxID=9838 RepID=A0A5N4CT50_CAMDR|nr:hypothetical protein Cadr_000021633 [Camelus dromedarius]
METPPEEDPPMLEVWGVEGGAGGGPNTCPCTLPLLFALCLLLAGGSGWSRAAHHWPEGHGSSMTLMVIWTLTAEAWAPLGQKQAGGLCAWWASPGEFRDPVHLRWGRGKRDGDSECPSQAREQSRSCTGQATLEERRVTYLGYSLVLGKSLPTAHAASSSQEPTDMRKCVLGTGGSTPSPRCRPRPRCPRNLTTQRSPPGSRLTSNMRPGNLWHQRAPTEQHTGSTPSPRRRSTPPPLAYAIRRRNPCTLTAKRAAREHGVAEDAPGRGGISKKSKSSHAQTPSHRSPATAPLSPRGSRTWPEGQWVFIGRPVPSHHMGGTRFPTGMSGNEDAAGHHEPRGGPDTPQSPNGSRDPGLTYSPLTFQMRSTGVTRRLATCAPGPAPLMRSAAAAEAAASGQPDLRPRTPNFPTLWAAREYAQGHRRVRARPSSCSGKRGPSGWGTCCPGCGESGQAETIGAWREAGRAWRRGRTNPLTLRPGLHTQYPESWKPAAGEAAPRTHGVDRSVGWLPGAHPLHDAAARRRPPPPHPDSKASPPRGRLPDIKHERPQGTHLSFWVRCRQRDEKPGSRTTIRLGSSPSATSCPAASLADCCDDASAVFQNCRRILQTVLLNGGQTVLTGAPSPSRGCIRFPKRGYKLQRRNGFQGLLTLGRAPRTTAAARTSLSVLAGRAVGASPSTPIPPGPPPSPRPARPHQRPLPPARSSSGGDSKRQPIPDRLLPREPLRSAQLPPLSRQIRHLRRRLRACVRAPPLPPEARTLGLGLLSRGTDRGLVAKLGRAAWRRGGGLGTGPPRCPSRRVSIPNAPSPGNCGRRDRPQNNTRVDRQVGCSQSTPSPRRRRPPPLASQEQTNAKRAPRNMGKQRPPRRGETPPPPPHPATHRTPPRGRPWPEGQSVFPGRPVPSHLLGGTRFPPGITATKRRRSRTTNVVGSGHHEPRVGPTHLKVLTGREDRASPPTATPRPSPTAQAGFTRQLPTCAPHTSSVAAAEAATSGRPTSGRVPPLGAAPGALAPAPAFTRSELVQVGESVVRARACSSSRSQHGHCAGTPNAGDVGLVQADGAGPGGGRAGPPLTRPPGLHPLTSPSGHPPVLAPNQNHDWPRARPHPLAPLPLLAFLPNPITAPPPPPSSQVSHRTPKMWLPLTRRSPPPHSIKLGHNLWLPHKLTPMPHCRTPTLPRWSHHPSVGSIPPERPLTPQRAPLTVGSPLTPSAPLHQLTPSPITPILPPEGSRLVRSQYLSLHPAPALCSVPPLSRRVRVVPGCPPLPEGHGSSMTLMVMGTLRAEALGTWTTGGGRRGLCAGLGSAQVSSGTLFIYAGAEGRGWELRKCPTKAREQSRQLHWPGHLVTLHKAGLCIWRD